MQDLRHAIRSLSSCPGFVVLAVLCLAIGIGANTMVFTAVNSVFLEALPFPESGRLMIVNETRRDNPADEAPVSYANFLDWAEGLEGVAEFAASRSAGRILRDGEAPERYAGAFVSRNWFPTLGVEPLLGRAFREDDDLPGAVPVVLLGEALWAERYARDPELLGRSLVIDGSAHTVVGVMPRFSHPSLPAWLRNARIWTPLAPAEFPSRRDDRSLTVLARLAPGVEVDAAAARLEAIARALETQPPENAGWRPGFRELVVALSPINQGLLLVMLGAVGCVLLIACANVANLMLARATRRRREIAMRIAVGASGGRIALHLLTESLIIGLVSVPLGVLVAFWGIELVRRTGVAEVDFLLLAIDARVLVFTVVLAIVTSLLFGLAPALHAVRGVARDALGEGGHDATAAPAQKRLRNALIVAEVALSVVLLIGASLFVQSFLNLLAADDELDTSGLMTFSIELPQDRIASAEARGRLVDDMLERIEALPGVQAATVSTVMPLRGAAHRATAIMEPSLDTGAGDERVGVLYGGVSARFFETLGMPLVRGRTFTADEARTGTAVAVVNERMAERLAARGDPLGQRFRLDGDPAAVPYTVIGVSRNLSNWNHSNRPLPTAYLPFAHVAVGDPHLLVRADEDALLVASPVREASQAADSAISVLAATTMDDVHRRAFWRQELVGSVLAAFGAIAAFLAAAGVYGVLSYLASLRTREIGVRVALGARYRDVVWLIARQGMVLVLVGVALGLAAGALLMRFVRGQLFEVGPLDPLTFAAIAALIAAVGFVASCAPAYRAASVDPVAALRD